MTEVPEDRLGSLERSQREMEEQLHKVEEDIETAQERAEEQRERIETDARSPEQAGTEQAMGDFEGKSSGAQQGEGVQDAIDEASVHEAEQVEPEGRAGGTREERDDGDDAEDGGDSDAGDAPVHEAERVDAEEDGD